MRVIAHLSDLHFGRVDAALIEPLRARVKALAPQVVVVSGDLTQRARPEQFREARRFLDTLPGPQVVVPGNHDIPLYNVFQRFAQPLTKYRRYITPDLEPAYIDDEVAVVGINTARSLTFKDGRINSTQIDRVRERLCRLPERVARIIVTHHPFDLPPEHEKHKLVGRAEMAMKAFAECGADIVLSGHLHATHTSHSAERYRIPGHSALIVQAGTATSTRSRGETNTFNALYVSAGEVRVERYGWEAQKNDFVLSGTEAFAHATDGWHAK